MIIMEEYPIMRNIGLSSGFKLQFAITNDTYLISTPITMVMITNKSFLGCASIISDSSKPATRDCETPR